MTRAIILPAGTEVRGSVQPPSHLPRQPLTARRPSMHVSPSPLRRCQRILRRSSRGFGSLLARSRSGSESRLHPLLNTPGFYASQSNLRSSTRLRGSQVERVFPPHLPSVSSLANLAPGCDTRNVGAPPTCNGYMFSHCLTIVPGQPHCTQTIANQNEVPH